MKQKSVFFLFHTTFLVIVSEALAFTEKPASLHLSIWHKKKQQMKRNKNVTLITAGTFVMLYFFKGKINNLLLYIKWIFFKELVEKSP